jgi:hypothetical protein
MRGVAGHKQISGSDGKLFMLPQRKFGNESRSVIAPDWVYNLASRKRSWFRVKRRVVSPPFP